MKPTIASLQKELAAHMATITDLRLRLNTQEGRREEAETRRYQSERETKDVRKELEAQIESEQRARQNTESIYDQHRSAVLHYFMAVANPETAKDVKRIAELQGVIVGLVPCRTAQPDDPWRIRG